MNFAGGNTWGEGTGWDPSLGGQVFLPLYEDPPELQLLSTFWSTTGQEFNTCLHVKPVSLVSGERVLPTLSDDRGNLYPQFNSDPLDYWTTDEGFYNANTRWFAGSLGTVSFNLALLHDSKQFTGCYLRVDFWRNKPRGFNAKQHVMYRGSRYSVASGWKFSNNLPPEVRVLFSSLDILSLHWDPINGGNKLSGVGDVLRGLYAYFPRVSFSGVTWLSWHGSATVSPPPTVDDLQAGYLFGEQSIVGDLRPHAYRGLSNYWLNYAKQHVFLEACESMPRLSDNSISNLSEIFEFLLSIVRREPPKIPSSLSSLWLAYRYQYSTTKMDIGEAISFVDRYIDLGGLDNEVTSRGVFRFNHGTDVTCRCQIACKPRQPLTLRSVFTDLKAAWRAASIYGLAPDLYYLWDSTPFSFIADWFVPIGDVLAAQDASILYTGTDYDFTKIEYSLKYQKEICGFPYSFYSRWYEDGSPPSIHSFYWFESDGSASRKQLLYRTLDAASLFIGG